MTLPDERTLLEGILYYISILMKYKLMIVSGTAAVAFITVVFSIISLKLPPDISPLPNVYNAYATVLFQEGGMDGGMNSMLSAFGIESNNGSSSSSQIALEILQSRTFVDKIIEKFDIVNRFDIEDKEKTTSRRIILDFSDYSYSRESGALTISYQSTDPVFAADLVNYEVDMLEQWFLNEGVSLRSNEIAMMQEKLMELTNEISAIEDKIESFQLEYGVLDITEIAETQSSMLVELRTQLSQTELEIADYTEYSTIEDPSLTILKRQRDNIVTQIHRIEQGYTGSDGRRMPSLAEMPELSLTFARLQADLELKNQLYMSLSERYEITKLTAAESAAFSVLEYAEIPEEKEGPARGQICVMATFGAFAGFIALAFILNMVKNIANDPEKKKILKGES